MTTYNNDAEGGSNGTAVTAANSGGGSGFAFSSRSLGAGAGMTYDSTVAAHGTLSYKLALTSGTATFVTWNVNSLNQIAVHVYVYFDTLPSVALRVIDIRNSTTATILRVQTTASNTWQVQEGGTGTPVSLTTGAFSAGTWYRWEILLTNIAAGTGAYRAAWYNGDSEISNDEVVVTNGQLLALAVASVNYGSFANTTFVGNMHIDDPAYNDTPGDYIGAYGSQIARPNQELHPGRGTSRRARFIERTSGYTNVAGGPQTLAMNVPSVATVTAGLTGLPRALAANVSPGASTVTMGMGGARKMSAAAAGTSTATAGPLARIVTINAATPAVATSSSATSVTSVSFTPPAGKLLAIVAVVRGTSLDLSVTGTATGSVPLVNNVSKYITSTGSVCLVSVPSSNVSQTVTVTASGTASVMMLKVYVLDDAVASAAGPGGASGASINYNATVTPGGPGSMYVGVLFNGSGNIETSEPSVGGGFTSNSARDYVFNTLQHAWPVSALSIGFTDNAQVGALLYQEFEYGVQLASVSAGVAAVTMGLGTPRALAMSSAGAGVPTVNLKVARVLTATAHSVPAVTAGFSVARKLALPVVGVSTVVVNLIVARHIQLTGHGVAATVAALREALALTITGHGVATTATVMGHKVTLAAASQGVAASTVNLVVARKMVAAIAGVGVTVVNLKATRPMIVATAALAVMSSNLAVARRLVAASAAHATVVAAFTIPRPLALASHGVAASTVNLAVARKMATTAAGIAAVTVNLKIARTLAIASTALAAATANLVIARHLIAAVAAHATATITTLGMPRALAMTSQGVATTVAAFTIARKMIATSHGVATTVAAMTSVARKMALTSAAVATVAPSLSIARKLTAPSVAHATVAMGMGIKRPGAMAVAGTSAASISGAVIARHLAMTSHGVGAVTATPHAAWKLIAPMHPAASTVVMGMGTTTDRVNNFDSGTDGASVTTSSIASSLVEGKPFTKIGAAGTPTFTSADSIDGALAVILARSSNTMAFCTNSGLATNDVSFSFMFTYKTATPNANDYLFDCRDTTPSSRFRMLVNSSGFPFIQNAGTLIATGTTALQADTQYRLDVRAHINSTTGYIFADFYTPYGTTPLFTGFALTGLNSGTLNLSDVQMGPVGTNTVTVGSFVMDLIRLRDSSSSAYWDPPVVNAALDISPAGSATVTMGMSGARNLTATSTGHAAPATMTLGVTQRLAATSHGVAAASSTFYRIVTLDASTPSGTSSTTSGTSLTTASFTPPAGALVLVVGAFHGQPGATFLTNSDVGSYGAYVGEGDTGNLGIAYVWGPSSGQTIRNVAQTFTVTCANSVLIGLKVFVFRPLPAVVYPAFTGSGAADSGSAIPLNFTVTPQSRGSMFVGAVANVNGASYSAEPNTTAQIAASVDVYLFSTVANAWQGSGSVTVGINATDLGAYAYVEVVPGPITLQISSAGSGAATGNMAVARKLTAASAGHSTTSMGMVAGQPKALALASQGVGAVTDALRVARALTTTAHGVAAATDNMAIARKMTAPSAGVAAVVTATVVARKLVITSNGSGFPGFALKATRVLTASVAGHATVATSLAIARHMAMPVVGLSTTAVVFKVARALIITSHGVAATTLGNMAVARLLVLPSHGVASVTATARVAWYLAAAPAAHAVVTMNTTELRPLAITIHAGSTATLNLLVARHLVFGSITGVAVSTASLAVSRSLALPSHGVAACTANTVVARHLVLTPAGLSTATENMIVARHLVMTVHGVALATETARVLWALAATSHGVATGVVASSVARHLVMTPAGQAAATAALKVARTLVITSGGVAVVVSPFAVARHLVMSSAGASPAMITFRVTGILVLPAAGVATTVTNLRIARALVITTHGVATDVTTFTVARHMVAASAGQAATVVALRVIRALTTVASHGVAATTLALTTPRSLAMPSVGVASAVTNLRVARALVGTAHGVATGAAVFVVARHLVMPSAGLATCVAALKVARALVATSHGVATVVAGLHALWAMALTSHGVAADVAALRITRVLTTTSHGVATSSVSLAVIRRLTLPAAGQAVVTSAVTTTGGAQFRPNGVGADTFAVRVARALVLAPAGVAVITTTVSVTRSLALVINGNPNASVWNPGFEIGSTVQGGTDWGVQPYFAAPLVIDTTNFHSGSQSIGFTTNDAVHPQGVIVWTSPGGKNTGDLSLPAGSILNASFWFNGPNGVSWQRAYRARTPASESYGSGSFTSTGSWQLITMPQATTTVAALGFGIECRLTTATTGVVGNIDDVTMNVNMSFVSASLAVVRSLQSSSTGVASVTETMREARSLVSLIQGVGHVTETLQVARRLMAASSGVATCSEALRITRSLALTSHAVATDASALIVARALRCTPAGVGSVTTALARRYTLSSVTAGVATVAAVSRIARKLTCNTHGTATTSTGLTEARRLAMLIAGLASDTSSLKLARSLTTTSGGHATGSTTLGVVSVLRLLMAGQGACTTSLGRGIQPAFTSPGRGALLLSLPAVARRFNVVTTGSTTCSAEIIVAHLVPLGPLTMAGSTATTAAFPASMFQIWPRWRIDPPVTTGNGSQLWPR